MALGGGLFTAYNKKLPGSYINFISAKRAAATLSDRGVAAMPLLLDWGISGEVFEVTQEQFYSVDCAKIFGYPFSHEKMKNLRELFKKAVKVYCYRLDGGGVKASNTFATAKYTGTRGNDIKIVVAVNVDDVTKFDVKTLVDDAVFETQTVATAAGLVSNAYVDFKTGATLAANAGLALSGGTNITDITGELFLTFLSKLEQYSFNTLGCPSTDVLVHALFDSYTARMRDTIGVKFQTVRPKSTTAVDHEGVIQIGNTVTDAGATGYELVFYTTGDQASCAITGTTLNSKYIGEYIIDTDYTQNELETFIDDGVYVYHRNGSDICVLDDINSFTSFAPGKEKDFAQNQVIRVLDQIAIDVGSLIFNKRYLGKINGDKDGQVSLWSDIVKQHEMMGKAIKNFNPTDVVVSGNDGGDEVYVTDAVTPNKAMRQLYMTVVVN
ncbi:MAG: phage tail sheath N-terminal beta-sandwich domain-containing protein [Acetobacterium sp.]|uniref:phage tail sheath subtilisin-like domain-containing protein n=1 Tax=Acetobacterium sp. TaxID=1872094 RepID=UPI003242B602